MILPLLWVAVLSMPGRAGVLPVMPPAPALSAPREPTEFHDEIERDFPLRSDGQLQITNMRGDIVIQGWSLDKIRVKARRRALTAGSEEARRLFAAVDFSFSNVDGQLELAAEYGRGLCLAERLREREHPQTGMQLTVYAPAHLKLRVWGVEGHITVKNWDASVDARASSGSINIDSVKSGGVSVLCPSCSIRLHSIRGPVRCMGESGEIQLSDIEAPQTYAESSTGALKALRVIGEQLYVTRTGSITGHELQGRIEFRAGSAPVTILESKGFLSGRSTSGDITARMRDWTFADKAVIESIQGNIRLSLPLDFSGEVDLFSGKGLPEVGFPIEKSEDRASGGKSQPGHVVGRVGDGGELLQVLSTQGSVQLGHG